MTRILDIALKDLKQFLRDFKTFMFLLFLPILFTFLFGYAFGGFGGGGAGDTRLPVGFQNRDDRWVSAELGDLLAASQVIRLVEAGDASFSDLEARVVQGELVAAVIVPEGYGRALLADKTARLIVIADSGGAAWVSVEAELLRLAGRLDGAVRTAAIMEALDAGRLPFEYGFEEILSAWEAPPISVIETTSSALTGADESFQALAHTAPGMMLQFAIAGLLTCAQVIVTERRSRTLQRLLTTAVRRVDVLLGHYLAIYALLLAQFAILIAFGQVVLKIDYLRAPGAIALVAACSAMCIAALGLLIGVVARNEEQAISFSLIPMFVFSGLGGAWVPLEVTGETFAMIGHVSPVAWAMDGFKNVVIRGFGLEAVLLPSAALLAYTLVFFSLAVWRLNVAEEKG